MGTIKRVIEETSNGILGKGFKVIETTDEEMDLTQSQLLGVPMGETIEYTKVGSKVRRYKTTSVFFTPQALLTTISNLKITHGQLTAMKQGFNASKKQEFKEISDGIKESIKTGKQLEEYKIKAEGMIKQ